jgi:hypothetical protein
MIGELLYFPAQVLKAPSMVQGLCKTSPQGPAGWQGSPKESKSARGRDAETMRNNAGKKREEKREERCQPL